MASDLTDDDHKQSKTKATQRVDNDAVNRLHRESSKKKMHKYLHICKKSTTFVPNL